MLSIVSHHANYQAIMKIKNTYSCHVNFHEVWRHIDVLFWSRLHRLYNLRIIMKEATYRDQTSQVQQLLKASVYFAVWHIFGEPGMQ